MRSVASPGNACQFCDYYFFAICKYELMHSSNQLQNTNHVYCSQITSLGVAFLGLYWFFYLDQVQLHNLIWLADFYFLFAIFFSAMVLEWCIFIIINDYQHHPQIFRIIFSKALRILKNESNHYKKTLWMYSPLGWPPNKVLWKYSPPQGQDCSKLLKNDECKKIMTGVNIELFCGTS